MNRYAVSKLLEELYIRGDCRSLAGIIDGYELDWFQCLYLAYALITGGCVISSGTGTGKTLVAAAYIKCISEVHSVKFVYVCKKGNLIQTFNKMRSYYPVGIVGVDGSGETLRILRNEKVMSQVDLLIASYEAIMTEELSGYLIRHREYRGLVFDESHQLGNYNSRVYQVAYYMARNFRYILLLSATPVRIDPIQIINQIRIIDPDYCSIKDADRFVVKDSMGKVVGYRNLKDLLGFICFRHIGFSRKQLGVAGNYKISLHLCKPDPCQMEADSSDWMKVIKGRRESDQVDRLVGYVGDRVSEKEHGLIYCWTDDNKDMLVEVLTEAGFRVGLLDGRIKNSRESETIQKNYLAGDLDVLVLNITTGLDLDSDYIYFYELTLDWGQLIGRGERGLDGKDLKIVWSVTEGTYEYKYFIENIYSRSMMLREGLNRDVSPVTEVRELLVDDKSKN